MVYVVSGLLRVLSFGGSGVDGRSGRFTRAIEVAAGEKVERLRRAWKIRYGQSIRVRILSGKRCGYG